MGALLPGAGMRRRRRRPDPLERLGLQGCAAAVAARICGKSVDEALRIGYQVSATIGPLIMGEDTMPELIAALERIEPVR